MACLPSAPPSEAALAAADTSGKPEAGPCSTAEAELEAGAGSTAGWGTGPAETAAGSSGRAPGLAGDCCRIAEAEIIKILNSKQGKKIVVFT